MYKRHTWTFDIKHSVSGAKYCNKIADTVTGLPISIPMPRFADSILARLVTQQFLRFSGLNRVGSSVGPHHGLGQLCRKFSTNTHERSPRVSRIVESVNCVVSENRHQQRLGYSMGALKKAVDEDRSEHVLSELMKRTLSSLPTLSASESVELLSLVAARQGLQLEKHGNQTIAQRFAEFWNQAIFEREKLGFSRQETPNQQLSSSWNTPLLEFYSILALIRYEWVKPSIVKDVWVQLHLIVKACGAIAGKVSIDKVPEVIRHLLFCSNIVNNMISLNHFYTSELDMRELQHYFLNNSWVMAVFINHFMDTNDLVTFDSFSRLFHMFTSLGIFSPEFLTTSILLYKRRSFELTSTGSYLLHQIELRYIS